MTTTSSNDKTYYDILEVDSNAETLEIKKAYRRLALLHHPDRNNGSAESTERFKLIGEAYEVLSDPGRRRQYDLSLREPSIVHHHGGHHGPSTRPHVDPFAQFNDLFRNDAFFHSAFDGMDDEFARQFQSTSNRGPSNSGGNWFTWLLQKCGVHVQMTTYSSTPDGGFTASSYTSRPSEASATNRQTRTYLDNQGRRVTVRSMERNGNKLEEYYIQDELVQRKVNGVAQIQNDSIQE